MPRVAEIDRAILAQLRTNGRMSYVELAKEVGASERTVRTHVRKMEEDGTIRGYTVREGGVGLTALVRIKVSPGAEIGSFACKYRSRRSNLSLFFDVLKRKDCCLLAGK